MIIIYYYYVIIIVTIIIIIIIYTLYTETRRWSRGAAPGDMIGAGRPLCRSGPQNRPPRARLLTALLRGALGNETRCLDDV